MESALLAQFCPLIWLDSTEEAAPYDARRLLSEGTVRDVDTDQPVGTVRGNQANSSSYISLPHPAPVVSIQGKSLEPPATTAPVFGKVDMLHLDGTYVHSLLYVMCFPPSAADRTCAHFVKVFVNTASMAVVGAAFGIEGELAHVWVDANDLKFADRAGHRVGVYLGAQDHTPLPAPGSLWRGGLDKRTPRGDGKGPAWQTDPDVLPWPNQLVQYLGRLGPDRLATNPSQRGWWNGATTEKTAMGARFIPL